MVMFTGMGMFVKMIREFCWISKLCCIQEKTIFKRISVESAEWKIVVQCRLEKDFIIPPTHISNISKLINGSCITCITFPKLHQLGITIIIHQGQPEATFRPLDLERSTHPKAKNHFYTRLFPNCRFCAQHTCCYRKSFRSERTTTRQCLDKRLTNLLHEECQERAWFLMLRASRKYFMQLFYSSSVRMKVVIN